MSAVNDDSFVLDVRAPTKTRTDDDTNDNDDSLCLRPRICIVVYNFRNSTKGCSRQQLENAFDKLEDKEEERNFRWGGRGSRSIWRYARTELKKVGI